MIRSSVRAAARRFLCNTVGVQYQRYFSEMQKRDDADTD
jgi:hypothetical protein